MSYATQQELVDRFGEVELIQLTDRDDPPAGVINATVVQRALSDADAEINGHLEGRYALPLATTPTILVTYACDIARYHLYDDRASEQVTKRYEAAMKFLRMVAEGKIGLGPDGSGDPTAPTGGVQHVAPEREFTRDRMKDY